MKLLSKVIAVFGALLSAYGFVYAFTAFLTLKIFSMFGGFICIFVGFYIIRQASKFRSYYDEDPTEEQFLFADALDVDYPIHVKKAELEALIDKAKSEL